MLTVNIRISIPEDELDFSFVRSSGPGGQNVNKVNSKAVLRWNALGSPSLPIDIRGRLVERFQSKLTTEGALIFTSDRFRDQGRNIEDCRQKLTELLLEVAFPPKKRRVTKPTRGSVKRRQESKNRQSEKKQHRGRIRGD